MIKLLKMIGFVTAIGGMTVATSAQAACWKPIQAKAAKVREMETMLMVSALRCRATPANFMDRYNAFVVSSRIALTSANEAIRGHFVDAVGKAKALNAYDDFIVRIANRYGAGVAGLNCEDMGALVGALASGGSSVDAMAEVADRAEINPVLDAPVCEAPMQVAVQIASLDR